MLARELVRGGDDVAVVTRLPSLPQRPPSLVQEVGSVGEHIYRLVGGDSGLGSFLDYHRPIEQTIGNVFDEFGPELVHVHHLKDLSPGVIELAHDCGAAVVMTLHDFYMACQMVHLRTRQGLSCDGPVGGLACARTCFANDGAAIPRWTARTAYFRWLLSQVEKVICPSQYVARFFSDFSRRPRSIRIVANGLLMPVPRDGHASCRRSTGQGLKLAFLGSVVDYKGLHIVVEALRLAVLPRTELLVLGQVMDDNYLRTLRARAAATPGLTMRLYGAYEPADLPLLLDDTDAVVIPSLVAESFSLTAREALALGIPVLAARIGALPEVVVDGVNGFTFRHDRTLELAALVQRLNDDPDLVTTLRIGARRTEVLTAAQHTNAVRTVYAEALAEAHRKPRTLAGERQEGLALFEALLALGFDTTR